VIFAKPTGLDSYEECKIEWTCDYPVGKDVSYAYPIQVAGVQFLFFNGEKFWKVWNLCSKNRRLGSLVNETRKSIAVMQPYFFPYAGYFQLFHKTDTFVILDCVQFPRRGWVHRNQFTKLDGSVDWLTLPIRKCPQETLIKDLEFDLDQRHSDFTESMSKLRVRRELR
jgi:hypothetical protein